MNYVIFDIDNCISDDSHRIPLIDWTPGISPDERYKAYHANAHTDQPHNSNALINWLRTQGVQVVFMTARPDSIRLATEGWLFRCFRVSGSRLMMREVGDHSPSANLKSAMLRTLQASLLPGDAILHAYDDRQDVVNMYNLHGVEASVLKVHDICAYTPPAECGDLYPVQGARPEPKQSWLRHVLYDDTDNDVPRGICDRNGSVVLSVCKVCDLAESELTDEPECAGSRNVACTLLVDTPAKSAGDILEAMAATFRERNAVYGSNYKMVAPLVRALFPNGVPPELVVTDQWHLFELKLVKLSRFAISNLTHMDSIHDDGVYSAMIESILSNKESSND